MWVAAILLIFVLAPIDTKGKKLDKTAKKIYGRRARGVLVIEVMIAICFWVCGFIVVTKGIASELEELIIKHPDIMDCAVIGIEDEMLGNKICVYAVARKNISLLDIRKHLEEAGIAMFKLPDVLRLVKRIPVTAMKKVDKEALRILEKEHYE